MLKTEENRNASWNPLRILAAAMFVVMVSSGYAISTHVESAVASTGQDQLAASEYFPAQYVNQAVTLEEHIQAF